MRKISTIFLVLFLCFVFLVVPRFRFVNAQAKTIVVPDDFSTIQEAINIADEGDTIFVKSGMYHENVRVNKSIVLVGENVDTTIIDGNPPEGFRIPIKIENSNVSVSGFKLLYGYTGITVGEVKFCNISGNRIAGNQHGITLVGTSFSNVTRNYFEQIRLSSAIQLSYSNFNLVNGNYIDNCTEGIQIWQYSTNNTVTENTIKNCDDVALRLQYADNNTIARNDISNCGLGTSIYVANNNSITKNNYINNDESLPSGEWEWYAKTFGYNGSINIINQNYYNDYNGIDSNSDGLGDTPYIINEDNQDNQPLMTPIEIEVIPEFPSWTPLIISGLVAAFLMSIIYKKRIKER